MNVLGNIFNNHNQKNKFLSVIVIAVNINVVCYVHDRLYVFCFVYSQIPTSELSVKKVESMSLVSVIAVQCFLQVD